MSLERRKAMSDLNLKRATSDKELAVTASRTGLAMIRINQVTSRSTWTRSTQTFTSVVRKVTRSQKPLMKTLKLTTSIRAHLSLSRNQKHQRKTSSKCRLGTWAEKMRMCRKTRREKSAQTCLKAWATQSHPQAWQKSDLIYQAKKIASSSARQPSNLLRKERNMIKCPIVIRWRLMLLTH